MSGRMGNGWREVGKKGQWKREVGKGKEVQWKGGGREGRDGGWEVEGRRGNEGSKGNGRREVGKDWQQRGMGNNPLNHIATCNKWLAFS